MATANLCFGDLKIEGASRAGDETWFRIHPPGLAFDVGRGAPQLAGAADIFLSHGHLDHALGLPFVLSLRAFHDLDPVRIFAPAAIVGELEELIRAAASLENAQYAYEVFPLQPGERVVVGRDLEVEAFATHHVVASLGFHLWRYKRRLKSEYRDRSASELAAFRARRIDFEELRRELWLSYTGDTGPEVFALETRLFETPILLVECTFFDAESRERGARFKHLHLQDLIDRSTEFRNREMILHHTSRRYDRPELLAAVERHLSMIEPRVHLFGM